VRALRQWQRKKGGVYDLQKLRSDSGAILSYFLLSLLLFFSPFSLLPVLSGPLFLFGRSPTAEGGFLQSKINLEAKNSFRRAFKGLDVKRYGKGDRDGSTGFYERFRGFFIGGLGAKIRRLLGVIYKMLCVI